MSTSSLSCADNQEFLVSAVSTIPKAEITEVEITHSINTKRKLHTCGTTWRQKKDPHSPHNLVWVLVSLYTQLLQKKKKKKIRKFTS